MPSLGKPTHPAFSLIEILITIAISAILTAIVFVGLKGEQQRSAVKDSADRLQAELIALQNNIQSAIAAPKNYCTRGGGSYPGQGTGCTSDAECLVSGVQGRCISGPPSGYGLSLLVGSGTYNTFADLPLGTTPANGINGGANDQSVVAQKSLGTKIVVKNIFADNAPSQRLDISFQGTNGRMTIYEVGAPAVCSNNCSLARIVLQNENTLVCYAITVNKNTGIVSKRQYSPTCI